MSENVKFNIHCIYSLFEECRPYVLISDVMASIRKEKSQNGDTLGPEELNVRLEQSNQGDQCEQDDQGEVSIIIFGMSESSGFQKYSHKLGVSGTFFPKTAEYFNEVQSTNIL